MGTPATIRRNPPRKAKFTSAENRTAQEEITARKRSITGRKALMDSFVEMDGNDKLKVTEECFVESRHGQDAGIRSSINPECTNTLHGLGNAENDLCAAKNKFSLDAVHQRDSIERSAEVSTSIIKGLETEDDQCDASVPAQTVKRTSSKVLVFLRIRPAQVTRTGRGNFARIQKPTQIAIRGSQEVRHPPDETRALLDLPGVCLQAHTSDSVTLITPTIYSGMHKPREEDFNGFSRIFKADSTQSEVFDEILAPRLDSLLQGESSLVVAMGPTSAGKTHTMVGSPGDPGLIPLSCRYLFASQNSKKVSSSMSLIISMFEIYSEQGGRSEKFFDLLQDGAELSLQQSRVKGLHEAKASTVEEVDDIFSSGLRRRTTASTAANNQSSRSHCIFNISFYERGLKQSTLTIADLAGFEREKKTKNQGIRFTESSFINNTSMVFGQCLRALLEHQKNPKKPLQKHFQYSMLTRYLKSYLEANGNMTLIVNVSPCENDYLDTAFVLRQAAPYSKIRVTSMPINKNFEGLKCEKRDFPIMGRQQATKRRKVNGAVSNSSQFLDKATIRQSQEKMQDPSDGCQGLSNDIHLSHDKGSAEILNDAMQASRRIQEVALPTPTVRKVSVLSEVKNLLIQEGVKNFDQVSLAILDIVNNRGHHIASEDLETRLQKQQAEIIRLCNEVESLKTLCTKLNSQISNLEADGNLQHSSLERNCPAAEVVHLANYTSEHQPSKQDGSSKNAQTSFMLSPCDQYVLTKGMSDISQDKPDCSFTSSLLKEGSSEEGKEINIASSKDVQFWEQEPHHTASHNIAVSSLLVSTQELNHGICDSDNQVMWGSTVQLSTEHADCRHLNNCLGRSMNQQVQCYQYSEGAKNVTKQQPQTESPQLTQISHPSEIEKADEKQGHSKSTEIFVPAYPGSLPQSFSSSKNNRAQEFGNCHGFRRHKTSNFEKGKLLALSMMQDIGGSNEKDNHNDSDQQPDLPLNSPNCISSLGPIGHDLEEILEIPLLELEKELWVTEGTLGLKIAQVLAKHHGALDIANLSRKYTYQRANCLRYCLAVVLRKMDVEGMWVSLSEKTISVRRQHFYAVVHARTVSEAAVHAHAGFEVESAMNIKVKPQKSRMYQITDKASVCENLGTEANDNKENTYSPQVSEKPSKQQEAVKRRRLQPLSSLVLHEGPNVCPSFADAALEESKQSHDAASGTWVGTLASLLTHRS